MKQPHLFDKSVVVERATSLGSTVKFKLEPLGENKVRDSRAPPQTQRQRRIQAG